MDSLPQAPMGRAAVTFDPDKLARAVEQACPEVCFAMLHGSASHGQVREDGDIDIALYVVGKPSLDILERVWAAAESVAPGVPCDAGFLNDAEPVYRFEALKGKRLFCRDMETYAGFFSLTCREYEDQMADYERQRRYRLEAAAGSQP